MLSLLKNVADFVTPVLTESHFADKGVLTPEEFVLAGDQLVFACRTWQWAGGNKGTQKKYLPEGKQFLITRNVPSLQRAHTYALADAKEEVIHGAGNADMDDAEGWLSTHSAQDMAQARQVHDIDDEPMMAQVGQQMAKTHIAGASTAAAASATAASSGVPAVAAAEDEVGDIDDMDATADNLVAAPSAHAAKSAAAAEEEFPDMEAFDEDDNVLQPAAPAKATSAAPAAASGSASSQSHPGYLKAEEPEDNIVKTRTYDISIVYDKYYRTPRVYLFGYDEHRQPLTPDQIMEDISADHANKTVTVETHPFLGVAMPSLHPCKHAPVMKRIIDQMSAPRPTTSSSSSSSSSTSTAATVPTQKIDVKQYLFIFLRFISSVLPTVEYDFTGA